MTETIIRLVQEFHPGIQAIYLFGSHADGTDQPESDVDIALLLPHKEAGTTGNMSQSDLRFSLEKELKRTVDLINLRQVSTVFQNEISNTGRCLSCPDQYEKEYFEMMVLSYYCKLNEERSDILESILKSKRIHNI